MPADKNLIHFFLFSWLLISHTVTCDHLKTLWTESPRENMIDFKSHTSSQSGTSRVTAVEMNGNANERFPSGIIDLLDPGHVKMFTQIQYSLRFHL